jgi:serine-type D-Ala-D-Ala carboxypeptidase/endopeptidase
MIRTIFVGLAAIAITLANPLPVNAQTPIVTTPGPDATYAALDADFQSWMIENNVPGLIWGVVQDGKVIHMRALGVQDIETKTPVTADTAFRIASMSKAFTGFAILKLREQGKLRLDDPVSKYIPPVKRWGGEFPLSDLLHHTAGFVTDDPWGDRQQPMPETEFSKLLQNGVPRSTAAGSRFEYSNFGYAMLGRVISNAAGINFSRYIEKQVFAPLGMTGTTYEVGAIPVSRLAIGYRWEDGAWLREPSMAHGAFGSMGGVVTTGNDYAKWVGFLTLGLSKPKYGIVSDPLVWKLQDGGGFPQARRRPGKTAADCRLAAVYAAGLLSGNDCELGHVLFHGGGFPGYGSHMLILPETGTGVFALSNRTYAGPSGPVWDAATVLLKSGLIQKRGLTVSPNLDAAYQTAKTLWISGGFAKLDNRKFAMNFFMDRGQSHWEKHLAEKTSRAGKCDTGSAVSATGNLSGSFEWICEKGKVRGSLLLAPTFDPQIQALSFEVSD